MAYEFENNARAQFDHAILASAVYDIDVDAKTVSFDLSTANGKYLDDNYEIIEGNSNDAGYQGVLVKRRESEHYIVVNRGTTLKFDSPSNIGATLLDVGNDILLAFLGGTPQDDGALELYESIPFGQNTSISMTGHSLGGYLTGILYEWFGLTQEDSRLKHAYTFDGAGTSGMFSNLNFWRGLLGMEIVSSDPNANVTNIRTDEGPETTSSVGDYHGEMVNLKTNARSSDTATTHGIDLLTDTLLVRTILQEQNPNLANTQFNQLLESVGTGEK